MNKAPTYNNMKPKYKVLNSLPSQLHLQQNWKNSPALSTQHFFLIAE
jgi:hypothetical protein